MKIRFSKNSYSEFEILCIIWQLRVWVLLFGNHKGSVPLTLFLSLYDLSDIELGTGGIQLWKRWVQLLFLALLCISGYFPRHHHYSYYPLHSWHLVGDKTHIQTPESSNSTKISLLNVFIIFISVIPK